MPDTATIARAYADFFARLKPDAIPDLRRLVAPDIQFSDPLHQGHGADAVERGARALFAALEHPRFEIGTVAAADNTAFVSWTMTFRRKGRRNDWTISGVSELQVDSQDRISRHVNYWDAAGQLYEHVPVLGGLMRTIRRKVVSETTGRDP